MKAPCGGSPQPEHIDRPEDGEAGAKRMEDPVSVGAATRSGFTDTWTDSAQRALAVEAP